MMMEVEVEVEGGGVGEVGEVGEVGVGGGDGGGGVVGVGVGWLGLVWMWPG